MPKPFPFALNIGNDICSIPRILRILTKDDGTHAWNFVDRILRQSEKVELESRLKSAMDGYIRAARANTITEWKLSRLTASERADTATKLRDRFYTSKPPGAWSNAVMAEFRKVGPPESMQEKKELLRMELVALRDWKLERSLALVQPPWDTMLEGLKSGKSIRDTFDDARNALKAEGIEIASLRRGSGIQNDIDMQSWIREAICGNENHMEGSESAEGPPQEGEDSSNFGELQRRNYQTKERLRSAQTHLGRVAQLLAGRFAAKEAVIKAHQSVRLTYQDIIIHQPTKGNHGTRSPVALILPPNGYVPDAQMAKISISHDEGFATAVCLAFDAETTGFAPVLSRRVTASSSILNGLEVPKSSTEDGQEPPQPSLTKESNRDNSGAHFKRVKYYESR